MIMKRLILCGILLPFIASCSDEMATGNDDLIYHDSLAITRSESDDCSGWSRPDDTYTYPVEIGTEEYNKLHESLGYDMKKVKEAFQIPVSVLSDMSTDGLIQSFQEYPFLMDYSIHSSMKSYVDGISNNLNVIKELKKREDLGRILLYRYLSYRDKCTINGSFPAYVSILLSIPEVCDNISISDKKSFVVEALRKASLIIPGKGEDGRAITNLPMIYVCGKIMASAKYKPMLNYLSKNEAARAFFDEHAFPSPIPEDIENVFGIAESFTN